MSCHFSAASAAATTSSGESFVPPSNEEYNIVLPPVFVEANVEQVNAWLVICVSVHAYDVACFLFCCSFSLLFFYFLIVMLDRM